MKYHLYTFPIVFFNYYTPKCTTSVPKCIQNTLRTISDTIQKLKNSKTHYLCTQKLNRQIITTNS